MSPCLRVRNSNRSLPKRFVAALVSESQTPYPAARTRSSRCQPPFRERACGTRTPPRLAAGHAPPPSSQASALHEHGGRVCRLGDSNDARANAATHAVLDRRTNQFAAVVQGDRAATGGGRTVRAERDDAIDHASPCVDPSNTPAALCGLCAPARSPSPISVPPSLRVRFREVWLFVVFMAFSLFHSVNKNSFTLLRASASPTPPC